MKQLLTLKIDQKYTLVRYHDLGFIYSLQITLNAIHTEPYAQHPESIVFTFLKKRARAQARIRFLPYDNFLIYEGWVEPTTEMFVSTSESNGFQCRKSLLSFDREYLQIAKRSVSVAPLLENITPMPNSDTAAILRKQEQRNPDGGAT